MATNIATALFGLADMWVIGRLGNAPAQGAVELGAKFMMGLLIAFNFLRTGTVALTAQAAGRDDTAEQAATLLRALAAGLLIFVLLLVARPIAITFGLGLLEAEGQLAQEARSYVSIRYWGAAPWLAGSALAGWLIGQRQVRAVLVVEVVANALHIMLDFAFVLWAGWGVAGIAYATLASETIKCAMLASFAATVPAARLLREAVFTRSTWEGRALRRLFALNRDLFLRTMLLTLAMLILSRAGAQQGAVVLAANGILFQLFMLSTLILDGFESAGQVLCGEAKGSANRQLFIATARTALASGNLTALAISLVYLAFGSALAAGFSTDGEVAATAAHHAIWIAVLPLAGASSFVLDGIYVGAAWTRALMMTMAAAMAFYCVLLWLVSPIANTELWLAFTLFFIARAAGQFVLLPRLIRRDFGSPA
ncbi:MAG: MATE family efflux transporter [Novosphingobium sp.]|nr:MATE family efflux transporter [Novosphingobium sp.]